MFQYATSKSLQWLDNGIVKGILNINTNFDFKRKTKRPMERTNLRVVLSVGRVNYNLLDTFIMTSLNDYYKKMKDSKDENERNSRITEYNTLYQLWYYINEAKKRNDPYINSYYDDLVYRLYLLGYHSS